MPEERCPVCCPGARIRNSRITPARHYPARTAERSTGGAHAIHGLIITNCVEIPNDFSLFSRVSAQVSVKRAGKYDARNRGHCLRLRGTASRLRCRRTNKLKEPD